MRDFIEGFARAEPPPYTSRLQTYGGGLSLVYVITLLTIVV